MELEDWNPMEEDYHSLAFNSYAGGRGLGIPIDRYPSWNRNKYSCQTVSLYVTGIPYEIDERGLKLIFSNYGRVHRSRRYFSKNTMTETCFGFVDFSTLKEAENAMRELNGKPPYNFRITFAKSKIEEKEQSDMREKELNDYLERALHLNAIKCLPTTDKKDSHLKFNKISRKGRGIGRGTIIINKSSS